jgi:hypothetical protein
VTVKSDVRRALRIQLVQPAVLYGVGQPDVALHPNLANVYERVQSARDHVGERLPGIIRDLSTNGAFVAGESLPLLSRVALSFDLTGYGTVEALGWVLWRRTADCQIPRPDGQMLDLPRGFGLLFESIALDARLAIHRRVEQMAKPSA